MATSNTAIKITSLPNIGNNIAPSTIIPVVNMAGVPTTQKANLQITGNLILAGAGTANFVPARLANLAYTVVNSYQPNITRLGNLNINTFHVSGGTNGQYLQTDGTGNLAWVSGGGSGNGVVGGSNTQIQYNNAGNFGGSSGLTWNSSTGVLSTLKFSVSSDATIYGNTALTNLNVAGNFTTNNIFTDNYFYANGAPFSGGGGDTGFITFNDDTISSINDIVNITTNGDSNSSSSTLENTCNAGNANIVMSGGNATINTNNIPSTWISFVDSYGTVPTGYTAGTYTDSPTTGGTGTGMTVDFDVDVTDGAASNISINNPGSGYTTGDSITVVGGTDCAIFVIGVIDAVVSNWTFGVDGNLKVPGGIVGPASANFVVYSNAGVHQFTFGDDGTFYAPDNVVLGGTSITIGPGSNTLTGFDSAVFLASSSSDAYVQAAIVNVSDIGSSDWAAYGHRGDDSGGWVDMGFTSSGFGDPYYTITGQGDGYVFTQSFYDGQAPGGRGGNLVLATGENGTVNDIIFATGGFANTNEFARISNANNALQFTSGGNLTGANVISANTLLGNGNLKLQPDPNNAGAYLDVYLTTGPDVHIAANGENLILGTDTGPNVKVSLTDVSIKTGTATYPDAWYNIYGDLNNLSTANVVLNGSVAYDSTGNIYILGSIVNENTFNGDSLFLKYTATGELLWHKTWTNGGNLPCGSVNASMRYQPISGDATIDTILWASFAQVGDISYIGTMNLDGDLVGLTNTPRAPQQLNNYRITDILSTHDYIPLSDAAYICGQNTDTETNFSYPSIGGVTLDNSAPSVQWIFSSPDINTSGAYFKSLDVVSGVITILYAVGSYSSIATGFNIGVTGLIADLTGTPATYLYQIGNNYPNDNIWIDDTCTDPDNNSYFAINNDDSSGTNNTYTVIASTTFFDGPSLNGWQKKISWSTDIETTGLIFHSGAIYTVAALNGDLALFKLNATTGNLVWARIISSPAYEGDINSGSNGYNSSTDISIDNSGLYLTFNAFTTDINDIPNSFTVQYPLDGGIVGQYGDFEFVNADSIFTIVDSNYTLANITSSATITQTTVDVTTAALTATATTAGGGWTNAHQALETVNIWTFDTQGDINVPIGAGSFTTGRIQSANGYPTLLGYGSGGHGGPEIDWMNGDDLTTGFNDANVLRNTMYLNGGGLYIGINENGVVDVATPNWKLQPDGGTIFPTLTVDLHNGGEQSAQTLQFGDPNQQAVITGPAPTAGSSAQRLIIQGQVATGSGEGGDVYVWGGDSQVNGGDIKIYAGDADSGSSGQGGNLHMMGGAGYNTGGEITLIGGWTTAGVGAYVGVTGGRGSTTGGNVSLTGGYGDQNGGPINITGGIGGNGLGSYGNVNINAGASTWTFDNTGNLSVPGSIITSTGSGGNISGANVITANTFVGNLSVLSNSSGKFTLLSDNTLLSGTVASPQNFKINDAYTPDIDLRNASGTGMFTQGANITLRTAGTYNWNFTNTGNLTTPGNITTSQSFISTPVAYSTLTAVAGARAFINDGNLVAAGNFGVQVGGSGSNTVPVWSNGTNWYIG